MNTIEQKFHAEIEMERLLVTTEQGEYVVFTMLPITMLLLSGLWDTARHTQLLGWFGLLTVVNLFRWGVLHFYNLHKETLIANIGQFKRLMLLGSTLTGLCWVLGIIWFLVPSEPTNVLIISVALMIQIVGAVATWYCYLPAVLTISLPPTLLLIVQLFLQGDRIYVATASILSLMALSILVTSTKLSKMLNHALRLNFENAALRQESEQKSLLLETALENMHQGISMTDKAGHLLMWNRQFTDVLGAAGAMIEKNADLVAIFAAADPPIQVRSPDWTKYPAQNGQVYEIRQAKLRQGGCVLTCTDISDQIKHEKALEKARKEAEKANAAKTRFLAAASHDLRQPIHALGLFFAELSDRVQSPETAPLIGQVGDSILAINSMLNALLDVSKLDAGVVKPAVEPFELSELLERLRAEFQPIALENHNQLQIRATQATVNTDPTMLECMLRNLIGNALRYTENGRVLVAGRQRGQNLVCQVWDNGSGIPKDQLEEIFIEFHQLQNPARDRRRGLGLGLAIVKRLTTLLQHDLKVISRFGRGSCFSITLPLATHKSTPKSPQLPEKVARANYSLEGCQVLVLDDDISVLESMQGLLSHWGCLVITAGSPAEAIDKLTRSGQLPELLIIDYRLTDNMSGIEVARNLQNRLGYPIAVLIITGDTGPDRLREANASGYPLLHKPVQPAKLRSTLQYLMGKLDAAIARD